MYSNIIIGDTIIHFMGVVVPMDIDDLGSKFELKVLNNDNIFRTRDYDENN